MFLPSILDFRCPDIWQKMKKNVDQYISYQAFPVMGWVSWPLFISMFLVSISAFWLPNTWTKMMFSELLEKQITQFFIPSMCCYMVSLVTSFLFRVPSVNFGLLVDKYLAEKIYGYGGRVGVGVIIGTGYIVPIVGHILMNVNKSKPSKKCPLSSSRHLKNLQYSNIGSDNGLVPVRRQAIVWTNSSLLRLICVTRPQWVKIVATSKWNTGNFSGN